MQIYWVHEKGNNLGCYVISPSAPKAKSLFCKEYGFDYTTLQSKSLRWNVEEKMQVLKRDNPLLEKYNLRCE